MTWWYWKYAVSVKKTVGAGDVIINIFSGKQQILEPIILVVRGKTSDDTVGTSESSIIMSLDTTSTSVFVLQNEEEKNIILPSRDYLSSFQTIPLREIILCDGDYMTMWRTFIGVNGLINFEIRARLSTNEPPTVTLGSNNEIDVSYHNEIIGVLE